MITTILPQIGIVCTVAVAAALYLLKAKRNAPITRKEAEILWKLHKQNQRCTSHKWQPQNRKNGQITGFQCQCGYRYTQKRPLLSKIPPKAAKLADPYVYAPKILSKSTVKFDRSQR
jgi:hypothetical protein